MECRPGKRDKEFEKKTAGVRIKDKGRDNELEGSDE